MTCPNLDGTPEPSSVRPIYTPENPCCEMPTHYYFTIEEQILFSDTSDAPNFFRDSIIIADEALASITSSLLALDALSEDFELASTGPINNVEFQSQPGYFIGGDSPLVIVDSGSGKNAVDDGTSDQSGSITLPFRFAYDDLLFQASFGIAPGTDFTTPAQDIWEMRFLQKVDVSEYGFLRVTPINTGDTLTSRNYKIEINLIGGTLLSQNIVVDTGSPTGAGGAVFIIQLDTDLDTVLFSWNDSGGAHSGTAWTSDSPGQFTSWLSDGLHERASIFYSRPSSSQSGFKQVPLTHFGLSVD